MTHFTLFSLPEAFDIDTAALERAYVAAQGACHPDKFVGKPAMDRQAAALMAARVNDAYAVLASPLKRAQYLLSLKGVRVGGEHDTVKPSPALLMAVMEVQEQAESALHAAKARAGTLAEEARQAISRAFLAENWPEMAEAALALGYWEKIAQRGH